MSGDEHREVRELLGSYALGHLPAEESARVEEHLAGCGTCPAELDGLRSAARLLDRVDPAALDVPPPGLPPGLEERIIAGVRAEGAARRRLRLLRGGALGAAAAGALAASFALGLVAADPDPGPEGPLVEAVRVVAIAPGVQASAGLVAHTWGTELKLDAVGLRSGAAYRVELVEASGTPVAAGTFLGTGEGELRCNLNAAVLREAAAGARVYDEGGRVVIEADLA